MNEHKVTDDRFDRRELLLHLGDILEAATYLAGTKSPATLVAQLAQEDDALRDLAFLRGLAPRMTVAEFSARVASAFCLWPKRLLEAQLNRTALASTVQRALFDGNPDGWNGYVSYLQNKVAWFGTGLPVMNADALAKPVRHVAEEAIPIEAPLEAPVEASIQAPVVATLSAKPNASFEKKGWPWPEPGSTT
ncbi:conserved hypothetical protein [Paraburkholderia ribeironis]|uniref:Uncharacterized protein n=1 Tax=Paraburkholderia ribeironis TaxID=1247936 RepID=A0A1N7SJ02_9BURK|nr:hypothetical protein [Paraburkholderia ribeironis]SIT46965.1 conserved hypothetical protein [Paraburkholderia ribeironis]